MLGFLGVVVLLPPALAGDWVLCDAKHISKRSLTLDGKGHFTITTKGGKMPFPPYVGTVTIRPGAGGEAFVLCQGFQTLVKRSAGVKPREIKLSLRHIPSVPALVLNHQWAYLPAKAIEPARAKLAIYWHSHVTASAR